MGFILNGLDSDTYDRNYSDQILVKRIYAYFKPYQKTMFTVAGMIALDSIASTASPILIAKAIDLLKNDATVAGIFFLSGGVTLLGIAAWLFNYIRQYFSAKVIGNVVLNLREDVFKATIGHDLSFYDEHPSGKIVSRITSDTQDFAETVNLTMNLMSQLFLILFLTIWLFTINVWLTLMLLMMAPIAAGIALSFRKIARTVTQNSRRITAVINAQIQESISGIMVAKTFRQESAIYKQFHKNNEQGYDVGIKRGITLVTIFPMMAFSSGIGLAILIYYGGLATRPDTGWGDLTTGDWYLFMQAVNFYWWPMMNIASFWSQFQDGLSAAERVFALIDADPKLIQIGNISIPKVTGEIKFDHLQFSYSDKELVLPDFSLTIKPGETIALVGHTGAGKSSIVKLISRFYEFQKGHLLIDNQDIRTLDLSQYRQQVGIVPQTPFLFSGTVRDNIRYGRPDATDEEIKQIANEISGGEWLHGLSNGLDTDVGERGSHLSMGQRQLVALARVLLADPAIFILDEATASIDPFTEMQIQEGLNLVIAQRTAIIIAHRLSTVRSADRILVLKNGRIIEEGSHDSLLAQAGDYAELYQTYFRHQSLSYIDSKGWALDS